MFNAKIGIALKHHPPVRVVLRQHIRARADRIPVERQVLLRHTRLTKKTVDLQRHRRKKRHRQPVLKLRIATLQFDAIGIVIDDFHAAQRIFREIKPGVALTTLDQIIIGSPQCLAELLEADDIFTHQADNRRMQTRMRKPLDLVFKIAGV